MQNNVVCLIKKFLVIYTSNDEYGYNENIWLLHEIVEKGDEARKEKMTMLKLMEF